jgi:2-polyprenyl-3-methyl-5-hydroxy-6-metoxy-1,4-benzoquinol methylase
MTPNQVLWEKSDFTRIAASIRKRGEDLIKLLDFIKNNFVLDLGCDDGITAIPVARLGIKVLGIDIDRLVEAGNICAKTRDFPISSLRKVTRVILPGSLTNHSTPH